MFFSAVVCTPIQCKTCTDSARDPGYQSSSVDGNNRNVKVKLTPTTTAFLTITWKSRNWLSFKVTS